MTVTLDDLLSAFIEAYRPIEGTWMIAQGGEPVEVFADEIAEQVDAIASWYDGISAADEEAFYPEGYKPVGRAAKVYVVARDEGLEAAMLWKVSHQW